MITYKEIAFVAYPSTDIDRSRKFFEGPLGLKPTAPVRTGAQWIEYAVGTGTIGVGKSPLWPPSNDGASAALEVDDFEEAVKTLRDQKIDFLVGPTETAVCRMVAIRDPDGNKITLHQRKNK